MAVVFDRTVVLAWNKQHSAQFFSRIFGLAPPRQVGAAVEVTLAGGVSLEFVEPPGEFTPAFYGFSVGTDDFDAIVARVREELVPFWADSQHCTPQQVASSGAGRVLYLDDPAGHLLAVVSRLPPRR
ncbi:VOC family protein [Rhodococcus opacus]|uniref:VOC family protein n=1 Tax=Rhodococcus opacus TaxID=37919 RepID=UPI0002F41D9A|nr:VOC family protein [Rhodococcus opacus]